MHSSARGAAACTARRTFWSAARFSGDRPGRYSSMVCGFVATNMLLEASGRRPEDLVLLDLPKALGSRQCTVDGEPLVRVSEVREVEPAEAGQRHPGVPDDEIVFRPAASGAISNVEVEGLAAPLREHGDRVVEGTGILRTQFEKPRELRG